MGKLRLFRGFFSYAHHDAKTYPLLVRSYTDMLEARVNARLANATLKVCRDAAGIRIGARWNSKIEAEVRASDVLILLLSPKWIESDYCRKEHAIFEEAEARHRGADYIAPILIMDVENQAKHFDEDQKRVFERLKTRQFKAVLANKSPTPKPKDLEEIADAIFAMIEQLRAAEPAGAATETVEEERLPDEVAAQLLASLDQSGETARAVEGGLERATILELARRLKPGEALDLDQAIKELGAAVGVALDVIATGKRPSNADSFVKDVLVRLAETTKAGEFESGRHAVDRALAELDAREMKQNDALRLSREALLEAGVEQDILRRDAFAVARRIEALVALDATDRPPAYSAKYDARLQAFYAEGKDRGVNFSLEIAIEMARRMLAAASGADQRGTALNALGMALRTLGERERGTARLEAAVEAYRAALEEWTRDRVPLDWAMTQNNLGNALSALGEREGGAAGGGGGSLSRRAGGTDAGPRSAPMGDDAE